MEPRELPPLTKRLVERVKNLRPESQIRLDYYLAHLHYSLDHEVQLHIWPTEATGVQPAILSLRTRRLIQSSSAVSLGDLAAEIQVDATEKEVVQPLIVFTSSEGKDAEREQDDRDASPRLQHLPEQLLTPKLNAMSKNAPISERGMLPRATTYLEGRMKSRCRRTLKARNMLHRGLIPKGLLKKKGDEDERIYETSSEG